MEDDLLRKFWEIEDHNLNRPVFTQEERTVIQHFESSHSRSSDGKYIVPLPRKPGITPVGESRTNAIRRFVNLERSLRSRGTFKEFANVVQEYFELNHAEPVPTDELEKTCTDVYYFPMHVVRKEDSTTSKIRVVFDASANSTSGTSLNDHFLIGPTGSHLNGTGRNRDPHVLQRNTIRSMVLHPKDQSPLLNKSGVVNKVLCD